MKYLFAVMISLSIIFTANALAAAPITLPQVVGKPVVESPANSLALEVQDVPKAASGGPAVLNSQVTEFGRATALTQPLVRPQADGALPKTDDVAVASQSKDKKRKAPDSAGAKEHKKTKDSGLYDRKADISPTEESSKSIK